MYFTNLYVVFSFRLYFSRTLCYGGYCNLIEIILRSNYGTIKRYIYYLFDAEIISYYFLSKKSIIWLQEDLNIILIFFYWKQCYKNAKGHYSSNLRILVKYFWKFYRMDVNTVIKTVLLLCFNKECQPSNRNVYKNS